MKKPKPNPVGPPLKNPESGPRKMVSMRLDQDTIDRLGRLATKLELSQAEVVDESVKRLHARQFPDKK